MIRSMTGFGREQAVINGREIIAEIRSVNHKFFEFSSKLPRNYQYLEPKLKTMLKEKITRGKVELSLLVYNIDVKDTSVKVNEQVASQYIEAIRTRPWHNGRPFRIRPFQNTRCIHSDKGRNRRGTALG